jgi:hypothetical protein
VQQIDHLNTALRAAKVMLPPSLLPFALTGIPIVAMKLCAPPISDSRVLRMAQSGPTNSALLRLAARIRNSDNHSGAHLDRGAQHSESP